MKKKNIFHKLIITVLALTILIPLSTLIIWTFIERWAWPDLLPQVFSLRGIKEIMGRTGQMFSLMISSIGISAITALLSVIIGVMTSRALVFYDFVGKGIINALSVLPFIVPATVFAMGIQGTFIRFGLNYTATGVIICHLIYSLPYAIRIIMEGTKGIGRGLEEQALVLGASPMKAFCKISLPLLVPVILSAFSMAYIVSFSQYFITLLIGGGKVKTFTIVMVPYIQSGDRNIAAVYSVVFLLITLIMFGVFERIANKYRKSYRVDYFGI